MAGNNHAAWQWIARWPDWAAPGLAVSAPAGGGKTHLGHIWATRSGAVFATAADLAHPDQLVARSRWVMFDDADRALERGLANLTRSDAETGLFHLHNLLREAGGGMLLTARHPPAHWPIGLPDLASRLRALPAVAIDPPDQEMLAALLRKLAADRQLVVGDGVITYAVARMERSYAMARRLMAALDDQSLGHAGGVTVPVARDVLKRLADDEAGALAPSAS